LRKTIFLVLPQEGFVALKRKKERGLERGPLLEGVSPPNENLEGEKELQKKRERN